MVVPPPGSTTRNCNPAFVFPEMQLTEYVPASWVPRFLDYVFLSFKTSTALPALPTR